MIPPIEVKPPISCEEQIEKPIQITIPWGWGE